MAEVLYPLVEPYDHGMLDVGDGNHVYWEVCGNPDGKPAAFVHGGPGSGSLPARRRYFDPDRYRLVLFDQRGCGRSTPHASDPGTDMRHNTTGHLLADMELLREHLGIDRWLLFGGSWGSTLQLAYAQRHPHRVTEMVIAGVTTTSHAEIDWLYQGTARFFPTEWQPFRTLPSALTPTPDHDSDPNRTLHPAADHDSEPNRAVGGVDVFELLAEYAELMEDPDRVVRERAADAWCAWEDTLLDSESGGASDAFSGRPLAERLALVRICAHYFAHGAWLEDGALLRDAGRLSGIPGVLIHGRLDLSSPLSTAWELARAWPGAELAVIDDSGHLGSDAMRDRIRTALDAFARPH